MQTLKLFACVIYIAETYFTMTFGKKKLFCQRGKRYVNGYVMVKTQYLLRDVRFRNFSVLQTIKLLIDSLYALRRSYKCNIEFRVLVYSYIGHCGINK